MDKNTNDKKVNITKIRRTDRDTNLVVTSLWCNKWRKI
jgi:hypothetical protein